MEEGGEIGGGGHEDGRDGGTALSMPSFGMTWWWRRAKPPLEGGDRSAFTTLNTALTIIPQTIRTNTLLGIGFIPHHAARVQEQRRRWRGEVPREMAGEWAWRHRRAARGGEDGRTPRLRWRWRCCCCASKPAGSDRGERVVALSPQVFPHQDGWNMSPVPTPPMSKLLWFPCPPAIDCCLPR